MDINAVIANLGDGDVTTGNITTGDIRKETIVTNEHREEFLKIIEELKREIETLNENTSREALDLIREDLEQETYEVCIRYHTENRSDISGKRNCVFRS